MPKRSKSIKRFFFLKNSKVFGTTECKIKVCENLPKFFLSLTNHRESEVSSKKLKFLSLFNKELNINYHLLDTNKKQISLWETAILILSDLIFGWWEKQKSRWFLGLFETDILIDLFWSLHDACLNACSVRLQSRIHGPNVHFSSWQYWSQKQKSPPKGIETKKS